MAETYAHSGSKTAPKDLSHLLEKLIELQNEDGSFGCISSEQNTLNMHRAYGNGWLIKGLSEYASCFSDNKAKESARRLGEFYLETAPKWIESAISEGDTKFYAVSISCFYHCLDGLMSLYRLLHDQRYVNLIEEMIPLLPPIEEADHSHMFLTIRRGLLEYYIETENQDGIQKIAETCQNIWDTCCLETGGLPERFWNKESSHTDEACSLFDWSLLLLRLSEFSDKSCWIKYATMNLENHIFYNQTYNGGFGSCEIHGKYPQHGKEAPWCCSLYGPYGLIQIGNSAAVLNDKTLTIKLWIEGIYSWKAKGRTTKLTLRKMSQNDTWQIIIEGDLPEKLQLYLPFWFEHDLNIPTIEDYVTVDAPKSKFKVNLKPRLWASESKRSPELISSPTQGQTVALHAGPTLLAHRFNHLPSVCLGAPTKGTWAINTKEELKGLGFYGRGTRVIVDATNPQDRGDVFLGVHENDHSLYLYPVALKESPDSVETRTIINFK